MYLGPFASRANAHEFNFINMHVYAYVCIYTIGIIHI